MSVETLQSDGRGRRGFSLVELLTVIAIIAVLMAMLFPVMVSQRLRARRSACAANMNQIAGALRMYKLDNGAYPPALFGFVHRNNEGTPGDTVYGLFPHWARNRNDFVCPDNPALGDFNARAAMVMPDDPDGNKMHLTPPVAAPDMVRGRWLVGVKPQPLYPSGIAFPVGDSYDLTFIPTDTYPSPGLWERHYQRQWLPMLDLTKTNLETVPLMGNTPKDRARTYARQLVFQRPEDITVVTACTYHRDYPDNWRPGQPLPASSMDVVLFLDGHTEIRPSQELNYYQDVDVDGKADWAGWQIQAK